MPDLIVRLDDGRPEPLNLIIEVTGERRRRRRPRSQTARPTGSRPSTTTAVLGRWAFLEVTDPWDAGEPDPGAHPDHRPQMQRNGGISVGLVRVSKPAAPTSVEADPPYRRQPREHPHRGARDVRRAGRDEPQTLLLSARPVARPAARLEGQGRAGPADLEVPAVPIYIQEQISPKALIEDLRATIAGRREQQLDLFGDFNGMAFEERVDFYHHPMKWSNRMILGDSLLVMTSLAEKEGLKGQVQTIYVDPPYGIKFGSNWQVCTRKRDVKDGKADDATRQPEQVRAFRDTWELGIHSYLSYLRDRLVVARELLTESGSIFVQIGDENVHLVRALLDEVFGAAATSAREIVLPKTTSRRAVTRSAPGDLRLPPLVRAGPRRVKYRRLFLTKRAGESGASAVHTASRLPTGESPT